MRLQILETGHRSWQKPVLKLIDKLMGSEGVPGPIAVVSYRRELFGKYFNTCIQDAMRKASHWRKDELELFAAFTSKLNTCRY